MLCSAIYGTYFYGQRALTGVNLRRLQHTLTPFRSISRLLTTLFQRRKLSIGQYLWVCNQVVTPVTRICSTPRLMYTGQVTEWKQNGVCPGACQTLTTLERPPPDNTRRKKYVLTTKLPIHEVPYYRHLYTRRGPPSFHVSEIGPTWMLWASHVDGKYLLNFFYVFSDVESISTTPLAVWIRVWVTSYINNSRLFMSCIRPDNRTLDSDHAPTQLSPSGLLDNSAWTNLVVFPFDRQLRALRSNKRTSDYRKLVTKVRKRYISSPLDLILNKEKRR